MFGRVFQFQTQILSALLALTPSCFRGPAFMTPRKESTTKTVNGSSGVAKFEYQMRASGAQAYKVQDAGEISGTILSFPAGALSTSATLSIESGVTLSGVLLEIGALSRTEQTAAGPAVVVRNSTGSDVSLPFSLSIPVTQSGLNLGTQTRVSVAYRTWSQAEGMWKVGLLPPEKVAYDGTNANFTSTRFGAFQAFFLTSTSFAEIESSVKVTTKREESEAKPDELVIERLAISAAGDGKISWNVSMKGTTTPTCSICMSQTSDAISCEVQKKVGSKLKSSGDSGFSQDASIYARLRCIDELGRFIQSAWSSKLALKMTDTQPTATPIPLPGSFTISSPASVVTNSTVSVSWGAASNATSYTVRLTSDSTCNISVKPQDTPTSTSTSFSSVADGGYYLCVSASNTSGTVSASNSPLSFTVDTTAGVQVNSAPPSSAVMNADVSSFSFRVYKQDSSTQTTWGTSGTLTAWSDSGCTSSVSGTLSSVLLNLNSISASAGVFNFTDVRYSRQGTIYLKLTTGSYSACTGAITFMTGGCASVSGVSENEGDAGLDYIITCRKTAGTNDASWSTSKTYCATGWHMCYPYEYSETLRAHNAAGTASITTNSNKTYLNSEGTLNDGSGYSYWTNSTSVACQSTDESTNRVVAGAMYWDGWAVYPGNTCSSDATYPENTESNRDLSSFRPNAMRFTFHNTEPGDGAVCCKNSHTYFSCSNYTNSTDCGDHGDACNWNGTSCDTL